MKNSYDIVIVGAGSAGCALAYRLTKESSLEVLLVEAGSPDRNPLVHMPMGFAFLLKPHRNNWGYKTISEPSLSGRRVDLPRGKILGGCSSINGMVYIRGQRQDFDRWASLGNDGWSYDDVLSYFIRSECNENGANSFHGNEGPLVVSQVREPFPIHDMFIEAAAQAGHSFNPDVNGAHQEGVARFPCTIRNGRRWSSARAFLGKGQRPRNLTVCTDVLVQQIVLKGKRAVGVELLHKGERRYVRARNEVVLCAGAINSPQILELSGIGQAERISSYGGVAHHDLPGVGENLRDHWSGYIKQSAPGTKTYFSEARGFSLVRNLLNYLVLRRGFLANPAATLAVFFKAIPNSATPDSQIHFAPAASNVDSKGNLVPIEAVTVASCGLRPTSHGCSHLVSLDPGDPPSIQLNYLATKHDQRVAVEAFKKSRDILRQSPLQDVLAEELEPGRTVQTDEQILEYLKATGEPVHHLAGTCKMGVDPMAVVSPKLKVHGISGLRVADASIMPDLVSGNTHATCVMIGERCADFILADHKRM